MTLPRLADPGRFVSLMERAVVITAARSAPRLIAGPAAMKVLEQPLLPASPAPFHVYRVDNSPDGLSAVVSDS